MLTNNSIARESLSVPFKILNYLICQYMILSIILCEMIILSDKSKRLC